MSVLRRTAVQVASSFDYLRNGAGFSSTNQFYLRRALISYSGTFF